MALYVPENSKHTVTVTSTDSAIQGDPVTIRYYQKTRQTPVIADEVVNSATVVDGDTVTGVAQGSQMTFVTDFAAKSIGPGTWWWQLIWDDSGTDRALEIGSESDNEVEIQVTDAP